MSSRWSIPLLIVLSAALVAALAVLVTRDDEGSFEGGPEVVSAAQLSEFAADAGHPVYWIGERDGVSYELTESSSGRIFIRYLEDGAEPGDPSNDFVTVGTYLANDGVAALHRAAGRREGSQIGRTNDGAVLLIDPNSPNNAHLAYPGEDLQIEVYSPQPGEGLRLASRGEAQPVP